MAGKARWKLKSPVAENTQGIVVSGFASLDLGFALFLELPEDAGGEWLAELDQRARAWADEYASLPPISVQMIKRSMNQVSGALDHAVMHMDADQWLLASQTEDFREAVGAFFAKRKPSFSGN